MCEEKDVDVTRQVSGRGCVGKGRGAGRWLVWSDERDGRGGTPLEVFGQGQRDRGSCDFPICGKEISDQGVVL